MNDEIQELMAENERLSEEIKRTREKLDLAEKYIRDNVDSKAPDYIRFGNPFIRSLEIFSLKSPVRIDVFNKKEKSNNIKLSEDTIKQSDVRVEAKTILNGTASGFYINAECPVVKVSGRCVEDGELSIIIRGRDYRLDGDRLPCLLRLKSVIWNGTEMLKGDQIIWHDEPYSIRRNAVDGEEFSVEITWEHF